MKNTTQRGVWYAHVSNFRWAFLFAGILLMNLATYTQAHAQGMSVNATGTQANASAILDASSTTQGVLVPRMTAVQRSAISSPATGLLVYQTDGTAGFYFYTGSSWTSLNSYTNVTTQGNTFNGASQLVETNTSGLIATSNLGAGTANNTKFLRGDNTWTAPIAYGNIRNLGSSSTILSTDQIVYTSGSSVTLPLANSVPKGFQINILCLGSSLVIFPSSGNTFFGPPVGSAPFASCTNFANFVSDGNAIWYLISFQ